MKLIDGTYVKDEKEIGGCTVFKGMTDNRSLKTAAKIINYKKQGKRKENSFVPVSFFILKKCVDFGITKQLAFALQIKNKYVNSTVYDYKPGKLTQFGLSYNTAKSYIDTLLCYKIAVLHNGNLTIRRLYRGRKNKIRAGGSRQEIIEQLQEKIIEFNLKSQQHQIHLKDLNNCCLTNPKNMKQVKRRRQILRFGGEISEVDDKLRMSIAQISTLLAVSKSQAQKFKRVLIDKFGFKFHYEIKKVFGCNRDSELKHAFNWRGHLFITDSYVTV